MASFDLRQYSPELRQYSQALSATTTVMLPGYLRSGSTCRLRSSSRATSGLAAAPSSTAARASFVA